jgi:putative transposase
VTAQTVSLEHPEFPVLRVCSLLGVPRSSLYRTRAARPRCKDEDLTQELEALALEFPSCGSRGLTAHLKKKGRRIGRKLVQRLMRERSLLCQIKRRWVKTTDSAHGLRRYANLAKGLVLTGPNQVWHSDITYIRLPRGFCYLATILDAHSRKIVGWSMSRSIDAALALDALRSAIAKRKPPPGWIHHSDQGVQYACRGYVEAVAAAGGQVSMSSKACPYDNAKAESFFATLKKEEVHLEQYHSFDHARERIGLDIDDMYNRRRLHSKLGYASPEEFEAMIQGAAA